MSQTVEEMCVQLGGLLADVVHLGIERDRLKAANAKLAEALASLEECHAAYCGMFGPGMDKVNASCMKEVRGILDAHTKTKGATP